MTAVSHYDVTDITDQGKRLSTYIGYDTNGPVIFTRDHSVHHGNISYTGSFSGGLSRNTFAYPTIVTDPDGYSLTVQYNYDMGVVTRTRTPFSGTGASTTNMKQLMRYDGAGRMEWAINQTSGAYTRWVYSHNTQVQQFQTIQTGAGEAPTFTIYDGVGNVRA